MVGNIDGQATIRPRMAQPWYILEYIPKDGEPTQINGIAIVGLNDTKLVVFPQVYPITPG